MMKTDEYMEFIANGAIVHRTLIPHPDPVPNVRPRRPARRPGRLLVRFGVGGRPAPWVTHGTSGTKADQRVFLRDWQSRIVHAAALAMRERGGTRAAVHSGPVEVWIDFVIHPDRRMPDRDNLQKGATDAMQGVIFINDCQVVGGECRRLAGPCEGAVIDVWAVKQPFILE
jgi:Holliday junction resolvase RusA-like endonuclease